jgi:signal transduction histidine kinase
MQKQLRHLSHEILKAQEDERKKISRELHDEISQILTGINVRLAALSIESATNAGNINQKIASAQRLVERSVATVHRFARELRPAMLDDLGLIPALTAHLKEVRKRTGLHIHLTAPKAETVDVVDSLKRTVLYRIAQEAIKNVAKHAQASLVNVSVQLGPDHILLEVTDNGKSFSVSSVLANRRRRRLGLIGMRERAEMVGGTFGIESVAGKGTTVRVRIPLQNGFAQ